MEPYALAGGLLLREARASDAEELADFNSRMHAGPLAERDPGILHWVRDLIARPHPTVQPSDFLVVQNTDGRIVSSVGLISQTWSFGGIDLPVGRIELVATDPAYRRRGLIRDQMTAIHALSERRGDLLQAITGIEWYYRQFGYEYALQLGDGRSLPRCSVPPPADDERDAFALRPATTDDIAMLIALDRVEQQRLLVACVRSVDQWRYELTGRSADTSEGSIVRVIQTDGGRVSGYVAYSLTRRPGRVAVLQLVLQPGVNWHAAVPVILRDLDSVTAATDASGGRCGRIAFVLGTHHPLYDVLAESLVSPATHYAWYIRVPAIAAFIRAVGSLLEGRLAASLLAGYSGELLLSFYRSGVRLEFERGALSRCEPWPEGQFVGCDAAFPNLTVLQLLFGYRSLAELRRAFPDCAVKSGTVRQLLEVLFPPLPSLVWPIS